MNLYNISTDEKILDKSSRQYARVLEYIKIVDNLTFFVFTKNNSFGVIEEQVGEKYFKVIPVYGSNKLMQIVRLCILLRSEVKIKRGLSVKKDVISPQDPFEIGLISYMLARVYKLRFCVQMHTDISSKYF